MMPRFGFRLPARRGNDEDLEQTLFNRKVKQMCIHNLFTRERRMDGNKIEFENFFPVNLIESQNFILDSRF